MGYEVLKREEERVVGELAEEMVSYAQNALKKMGLKGRLMAGALCIGGDVTKGQLRKISGDMSDFFLEKGKELADGKGSAESMVVEFGERFYHLELDEEEMRECGEVVAMEASKFRRLMDAPGESYEDLYRNAYGSREEALSDLEQIHGKETSFFSRIELPSFPMVPKEFMKRMLLASMEKRKEKYLSMIEKAFSP